MDEMIASTRLSALVRYWNSKCVGRPMPPRMAIDPIEIPRILPIVLLADATPDGLRRMRLMGTEATEAYGAETRGRLVHEIQFGEFNVSWQGAFDEVVRSARPAFAAGTYRRETELCSIEMVLMPLTGGGSSVSQIFGGLVIKPIAYNEVAKEGGRRVVAVPRPDRFDHRRAGLHRL